MRGHFAKANVEPRRKVVEFRVASDAVLEVGAELSAAHFIPGQLVDVTGTSIGKGFAGAMKRHNFHGLRARSEEHTSELQSLMRSSYAVSCLTQKTATHHIRYEETTRD